MEDNNTTTNIGIIREKIRSSKPSVLGVSCSICGEVAIIVDDVDMIPMLPKFAICDKCKKAVMEMRKQMNL